MSALTTLDISGTKVTRRGPSIETPSGPYLVEFTRDGRRALAVTREFVSTIDLTAEQPRILGQVAIAPGGEGLAIRPQGDLAVTVSLRGSNASATLPGYHRTGAIDVFRIEPDGLVPVQRIEVGRVPEAAVFTPDGRYLYVGNFLDENFWIFRVEGGRLRDTGKRLILPGQPASARGTPAGALGGRIYGRR